MNRDSQIILLFITIVGCLLLVSHEGLTKESRTLAVLSSFPVHYTDKDEDSDKRAARLLELQTAVDSATRNYEERAALLTLLKYESGTAAYVQEGRCSDGPRGKFECDSGRAKGPWQLHGEVPDDLSEQAALAIKLWRAARLRCSKVVPNEHEGAFSGYATGGKCGWGGAPRRVTTMLQLWRKL